MKNIHFNTLNRENQWDRGTFLSAISLCPIVPLSIFSGIDIMLGRNQTNGKGAFFFADRRRRADSGAGAAKGELRNG